MEPPNVGSVWEEYEEAENFFKKIRNLRDESMDKSMLSEKLRDAVADNPDAFVNLMDDMLDVLKSTKRGGLKGESRREPKDLLVFPATSGISEYNQTYRRNVDPDEVSVCKSVITFGGSMDEVEVRYMDDDESLASAVTHASYATCTLRNLRLSLNKNTHLASSLAREVDILTDDSVSRPSGKKYGRNGTTKQTKQKPTSRSSSMVREFNLPPSDHRDDVSLLSETEYADTPVTRDPSGKKNRKGMLGWIFKPKKPKVRSATREKKRSNSARVPKLRAKESPSVVSQPLVVHVAQSSSSKTTEQRSNLKKAKGGPSARTTYGNGAFVPIGSDQMKKSRMVLSTLQPEDSKMAQEINVLDCDQEASWSGGNDRGHFVNSQDPSDKKRNSSPTGEWLDHVLRIVPVPKAILGEKNKDETRDDPGDGSEVSIVYPAPDGLSMEKPELETSSSPSHQTEVAASPSVLDILGVLENESRADVDTEGQTLIAKDIRCLRKQIEKGILEKELGADVDTERQTLIAKDIRCLRKQIEALSRELSDVPDGPSPGTQDADGSGVWPGKYRHVGTISFAELFPRSSDSENASDNKPRSKVKAMANMEEPRNDINKSFSGNASLEQESLCSAESEEESILPKHDNLATSFLYAMGNMLVNQMADTPKGVQ
jgi:hypothetical protein